VVEVAGARAAGIPAAEVAVVVVVAVAVAAAIGNLVTDFRLSIDDLIPSSIGNRQSTIINYSEPTRRR
jgi:hypothetical protein